MKKSYFSEKIIPFFIFLIVLIVYTLTTNKQLFEYAGFQHYVSQAYSFINFKTNIENPTSTLDLSSYKDKWFSPFPPLPAIILIPFVLLFGLKLQVIYIMLFVGSINSVIIFFILKKLKLNLKYCIWLTFAFAFGTVHWWSSVRVGVWFMAHIFSILFLGLSIFESLNKKRPYLMGLLLGSSFLCRTLTILSFPYFIFSIVPNVKSLFSKKYRKDIIIFGLTLSVFVFGYLLFNFVRFDNPFNDGYSLMNANVMVGLKESLEKYGLFNLHYLPQNLYTIMFASVKLIDYFPYIQFDGFGLAYVFASPFLFYALKAGFKKNIFTWISILLILIPLLFYYGNGWYQFGYRYGLDFTPFLFVLLAKGLKNNFSIYVKILIIFSIIINFMGVIFLVVPY